MNRSLTASTPARNVRVDAFVAQMHRSDRAAVADAIARRDVAELERQGIAKRIKQARKEAGLSQPEMADALGVIPRTYQNYESTKDPRVPWGLMNEIAKVTGKSTEWLIHGDTQTPDPFAGAPSGLEQRLADLESKLEARTDHDQLVRDMLARQTEILTRIERLMAGLPSDERVDELAELLRGGEPPGPQERRVRAESERARPTRRREAG